MKPTNKFRWLAKPISRELEGVIYDPTRMRLQQWWEHPSDNIGVYTAADELPPIGGEWRDVPVETEE